MPCPDAHYTLELINHETGDRLKIELIDLPFPGARSYDSHLPLLTPRASSMSRRLIRLLPRRAHPLGSAHPCRSLPSGSIPAGSIRVRVNGEWARKVPLASKTMVTKQLRGWLVKH